MLGVSMTSHGCVLLLSQGKGDMTTFWLHRHKSQSNWEELDELKQGADDGGGDATFPKND